MKKVKIEKKKKKDIGAIIALIIGIGYIILIVCLFTLGFLANTIGKNDVVIDENNNKIIVDDGKLLIDKPFNGFYDRETKMYYVTGYATNNTDEQMSDVYITLKLYDCANNLLGTASTYIENLDAKEVWKFKVFYADYDASDVCNYKFESADFYDWD